MITVMPTRAKITEELIRVKTLVNDAIDAAFDDSPRVDGAINWGDLFCVETAFVIDDEESEGHFRVTIQEADPVNQEFQERIQDYLKERGYEVVVVTEW